MESVAELIEQKRNNSIQRSSIEMLKQEISGV